MGMGIDSNESSSRSLHDMTTYVLCIMSYVLCTIEPSYLIRIPRTKLVPRLYFLIRNFIVSPHFVIKPAEYLIVLLVL